MNLKCNGTCESCDCEPKHTNNELCNQTKPP